MTSAGDKVDNTDSSFGACAGPVPAVGAIWVPWTQTLMEFVLMVNK